MNSTLFRYAVFSIIGFIIYVPSTVAASQDTLSKIRETRTITIANREASIPFSYLDAEKKPIGYALDICIKLADAVRRELKLPQLNVNFQTVLSSTRISSIVNGDVDLECGSTTNNAERREQVAFTIPHFISGARMMVNKNSGIRNWADLKGKRVVTTRGTTSVKLLNERNKVLNLELEISEAQDHNQAFELLEKKQAEAFVMDDVLLYALRASSSHANDFVIVGEPLSTEAYAVMMRKNDPAFKALIDKEMVQIIGSGEMLKLYNKWFMNPLPNTSRALNMPVSFLLRDIMRFPTDNVGG